jgi:uncharacterized protein YjiS (DUF1127 family)
MYKSAELASLVSQADRSRTLDKIIVGLFRAAGTFARRVQARHRQRRKAKATYDALRQLDDRMLRDLGFDRSEITSVAAEVTGKADRTRVRALRISQTPPYLTVSTNRVAAPERMPTSSLGVQPCPK